MWQKRTCLPTQCYLLNTLVHEVAEIGNAIIFFFHQATVRYNCVPKEEEEKVFALEVETDPQECNQTSQKHFDITLKVRYSISFMVPWSLWCKAPYQFQGSNRGNGYPGGDVGGWQKPQEPHLRDLWTGTAVALPLPTLWSCSWGRWSSMLSVAIMACNYPCGGAVLGGNGLLHSCALGNIEARSAT